MARRLTENDLRNRSGEILDAVDRGESFVVVRSGVPVGELVPFRRRRFVPRKAVIAAFAGAPAIDGQRFRADVERFVTSGP